MSATDRALNDQEFFAGCVRAATRLERHLRAWEDGDDIAADDVATVVRTLVANGPANSLIRRLVKRSGLPEPVVEFVPLERNKYTVLAIGSLPLDDGPAAPRGAVGLPFTKWTGTEIFYSSTLSKAGITVADFANVCGTRFGAHLHPSIPRDLETMRLHRLGFQSVADLLLWSLGVTSQRALAELLGALELEYDVRPRTLTRDGSAFSGMSIARRAGGAADDYQVAVQFMVGEDASDGPIFEFEIGGAKFVLLLENEHVVMYPPQ